MADYLIGFNLLDINVVIIKLSQISRIRELFSFAGLFLPKPKAFVNVISILFDFGIQVW